MYVYSKFQLKMSMYDGDNEQLSLIGNFLSPKVRILYKENILPKIQISLPYKINCIRNYCRIYLLLLLLLGFFKYMAQKHNNNTKDQNTKKN